MLFIALLIPIKTWAVADFEKKALSDNEMRLRIDNMVGPIDYRYNSKVRSEVEAYIFDYPKGAEELLGRITIYFPMFEQKLREKNLPKEIKYLSIIESSLKVEAYSRVGAAGLWQFMRGTARQYGLTINKSYDQRFEVEKSTDAALEYLSDLYNQFDDWTLALAAYNCGPGNVRKAMRKSGKRDYWSIRPFLPKETRNYIPKFVAASYLMEYYNEHNLIPVRQEDFFFETAESKVFQHLSFNEISRLTDTPMEIIKRLNPSYRKFFIPANTNGLILILPKQSMYVLLQNENLSKIQLIPDNKIDVNQYILSNFRPEIARYLMIDSNEAFHIPAIPVKNLTFHHNNNMENAQVRIHNRINKIVGTRRLETEKEYISYRLKAGESLKDVVNKFPSSNIQTIIRINNVKLDYSPPPGTLLKIMEI